jgi:hypothetical protein
MVPSDADQQVSESEADAAPDEHPGSVVSAASSHEVEDLSAAGVCKMSPCRRARVEDAGGKVESIIYLAADEFALDCKLSEQV